jgi:hypothetical protein
VEMVPRRLLMLKSENLLDKVGHYVMDDGVWVRSAFHGVLGVTEGIFLGGRMLTASFLCHFPNLT